MSLECCLESLDAFSDECEERTVYIECGDCRDDLFSDAFDELSFPSLALLNVPVDATSVDVECSGIEDVVLNGAYADNELESATIMLSMRIDFDNGWTVTFLAPLTVDSEWDGSYGCCLQRIGDFSFEPSTFMAAEASFTYCRGCITQSTDVAGELILDNLHSDWLDVLHARLPSDIVFCIVHFVYAHCVCVRA